MRWTRSLRKTNASARGRRSRVVLTPRRWRQVARNVCGATVARKPVHRGEREVSRKPLRREGRMPPLNLYARVRFLMCILAHETAGAACTRSSLRPLRLTGAEVLENLGQI